MSPILPLLLREFERNQSVQVKGFVMSYMLCDSLTCYCFLMERKHLRGFII